MAQQQLVVDELIGDARRTTGLERFDSDSFREGLEIFVADVNRSQPPQTAIERLRGAVVGALAGRLKTTAYLEQRIRRAARR